MGRIVGNIVGHDGVFQAQQITRLPRRRNTEKNTADLRGRGVGRSISSDGAVVHVNAPTVIHINPRAAIANVASNRRVGDRSRPGDCDRRDIGVDVVNAAAQAGGG